MYEQYVVHVYGRRPYDVYVGRGRDPRTNRLPRANWGNRWSHKDGTLAEFKTKTVEEAVARHREWVLSQPELVVKIKRELKDKVLGCWCRTQKHPNSPCHALTLAEIANT